jgi:2,4-dienoyl-CoA reductase (NADPH2)
VDSDTEMGKGIVLTYKFRVFYWLEQKGVPLFSGVKYEGITDKGLNITTKEGEKKLLEADAIIPALPMVPDTELAKRLEGTAPKIYQIGDCVDPALIVDAIAEGSRLGRAI